jgi:hypothetical protein
MDETGTGVADASTTSPRISALAEHASRANWVTEEPDLHLWPHLESAIEADGSPWTEAEYTIDADGVLLVSLARRSDRGERAPARLRADVLALIGTVVEGATYVEIPQERPGADLVVDVVTGVLDDQTTFQSHGHTLRLVIEVG